MGADDLAPEKEQQVAQDHIDNVLTAPPAQVSNTSDSEEVSDEVG